MKVELLKKVGPYEKGTTLNVDDKSGAQLVESKRAKKVDDNAQDAKQGD